MSWVVTLQQLLGSTSFSFLWRYFSLIHILGRETRRCSWLRNSATRRNVAGSIPDGVIGIFH